MNTSSKAPNSADMEFSGDEWLRYTRHIQLPQFGLEGQQKLKHKKVLIVGAGGLGSPVALYLAAAGVGTLSLIDHDDVDISNLQRQILFTHSDVGLNKAERGKKHLNALNNDIVINAIAQRFEGELAEQLICEHDLILDCTDNFATRYQINDLCFKHQKPWIFASIYQFSGQCALFSPGNACFRCLFPDYPENVDDCNAAGVIGVLPGLLGTLQASEAIKQLAGLASPLDGSLLLVDAMQLSFRTIKLAACSECACCSGTSTEPGKKLSDDYVLPACDSTNNSTTNLTIEQFEQALNGGNYTLLDVRSAAEHQAFNIGGKNLALAQIENGDRPTEARKDILLYCQSGVRSAKAAELLGQQGLKAFSLQGGLLNWLRSGRR
ncbi:HesA/MoeB/ThiF family protein [Agaribacterium haliotis]|uniref:HesA/MoeB/ThiF family protein n=1 Tax=Agaribacterium haliotis TaxID=2013869 RepID=UPI000BB54AC3|nr:HesA/MoeB/ThiF family protein [Agaribacterium haliotis]